LLTRVLGAGDKLDLTPARLPGARVHWDRGQGFAVLVEDAAAVSDGLLLDDRDADRMARVEFYASVFGLGRRDVVVETAQGSVPADVYVGPQDPGIAGAPWTLEDWADSWGALSVRAAEEVMDRMGRDTPGQVGRRFASTRARAASWCRAQADSTPSAHRSGLTAADVQTEARRRPYSNFFMVEEQDLRFRRFDGTFSAPVTRAAFVMGDAVTVLPYDPRRDRVLLIEQFRFGPLTRGDRHPWSLEPIAGRIDPGETPEVAARRETQEEAGLTLGRLAFVARYYPSPGAISEYLFSYVGLADLPDDAARTGGLESENEDIRGVLVDYADIAGLIAGGEAENVPLLLTLHWLMAHRDRLRGA